MQRGCRLFRYKYPGELSRTSSRSLPANLHLNLHAFCRTFNKNNLRCNPCVRLGIMQAHRTSAQAYCSPRLFDIPHRPAVMAALWAQLTRFISVNINTNRSLTIKFSMLDLSMGKKFLERSASVLFRFLRRFRSLIFKKGYGCRHVYRSVFLL